MSAKKTLLSAATASARSRSVACGSDCGTQVMLTVRGTIANGSGSIDVSHDDGTNWIPTGVVLNSSTRAQLVTLKDGMSVSVNYTADSSSSPRSSWTVEAS